MNKLAGNQALISTGSLSSSLSIPGGVRKPRNQQIFKKLKLLEIKNLILLNC